MNGLCGCQWPGLPYLTGIKHLSYLLHLVLHLFLTSLTSCFTPISTCCSQFCMGSALPSLSAACECKPAAPCPVRAVLWASRPLLLQRQETMQLGRAGKWTLHAVSLYQWETMADKSIFSLSPPRGTFQTVLNDQQLVLEKLSSGQFSAPSFCLFFLLCCLTPLSLSSAPWGLHFCIK